MQSVSLRRGNYDYRRRTQVRQDKDRAERRERREEETARKKAEQPALFDF